MNINMKRPNFSVLTEARTRVAALGTVFLILVSAAAGFVGGWAGSRANQKGSFDTSTSKQIISSESELISSIAKDAGPSVVSVNVMGAKVSLEYNPLNGKVQALDLS